MIKYAHLLFIRILLYIYLCVRDAPSFCCLTTGFSLFNYWSLSFFLSQKYPHAHNSKLPTTIRNSFSRVTEPFHFRFCWKLLCLYNNSNTHSLPIGIERKHLLLDISRCVECTWLSWHFLVLQTIYDMNNVGRLYGPGKHKKTQHFVVVVILFLLNNLKSQTILISTQTETINTIVHDFWKLGVPEIFLLLFAENLIVSNAFPSGHLQFAKSNWNWIYNSCFEW